jgi:hypothetical protein
LRTIEEGSNLLARELLVFTQDDDFAELHGKLLDRRSHLLALDPVYVVSKEVSGTDGECVGDK